MTDEILQALEILEASLCGVEDKVLAVPRCDCEDLAQRVASLEAKITQDLSSAQSQLSQLLSQIETKITADLVRIKSELEGRLTVLESKYPLSVTPGPQGQTPPVVPGLSPAPPEPVPPPAPVPVEAPCPPGLQPAPGPDYEVMVSPECAREVVVPAGPVAAGQMNEIAYLSSIASKPVTDTLATLFGALWSRLDTARSAQDIHQIMALEADKDQ